MGRNTKTTRKRPLRTPIAKHGGRFMRFGTALSPAEKLLHKRRVHWFLVLVVGLLFIQFAYNMQANGQAKALGLTTTIAHQQLLTDTNSRRHDAGLADLELNTTLSQAAQAKADDMIAKNYWSHNQPSGSEPWQFITKAGYQYQTAGENLAYGFNTSEAVIAAWMKSPSHRDNIMGNYHDIGFGYADGEYQGDENTVVVAFFGTPGSTTQPARMEFTFHNRDGDSSQHVLGASVMAAGAATWGSYASLGFTAAVTLGFIATHIELMRLSWQRTKRFMVLHPLIDAIVIAVVVVIIIQAAGGFIQ